MAASVELLAMVKAVTSDYGNKSMNRYRPSCDWEGLGAVICYIYCLMVQLYHLCSIINLITIVIHIRLYIYLSVAALV